MGGDGRQGGRCRVPARGRGRSSVGVRQDVPEEPLAGTGDQDRPAQGAQLGQPGHQGEVVPRFLGEAESGVDHEPLRCDARGVHAGTELCHDLCHHVPVDGAAVHVAAEAAPVHQDEGDAAGCHGRRHGGVGQAPADVVHEDRARLDRPPGDSGAHGVDGHQDALGDQSPDDRDDPAQLLALVDAGRAGTGRFAADVDQVGAVGHQAQAALDGGGRVESAAAVGERVRGHVDDSHDRAAVPVGQSLDGPGGWGRCPGCGFRCHGTLLREMCPGTSRRGDSDAKERHNGRARQRSCRTWRSICTPTRP